MGQLKPLLLMSIPVPTPSIYNIHNVMQPVNEELYLPYTCMQHWKKLVHQEGEPCPVARSGHAAVCLGYGGDHPYILVIGGLDVNKTDLCDAWMLDLQSGKWKEVRVRTSVWYY